MEVQYNLILGIVRSQHLEIFVIYTSSNLASIVLYNVLECSAATGSFV